MTRRIGNILIIEEGEPSICQVCGDLAELRPYGINGENICFSCGEKNQEETNKQMFRQLFDTEVPKGFSKENPMQFSKFSKGAN